MIAQEQNAILQWREEVALQDFGEMRQDQGQIEKVNINENKLRKLAGNTSWRLHSQPGLGFLIYNAIQAGTFYESLSFRSKLTILLCLNTFYQLKILGTAIERNTIVLLETGSGKTHIAVLLMKYIAQNLKKERKKCLIIFLAPAVALAKQQFEYITRHTNLRVACYIGGRAVKDWKEATLNEVLVMTPQILLDGLDSNSLTLDIVNLMVLDECHHACKKHPYAKIMRVYQTLSQNKPKIFGMSASLVTKKGVSSNTDCEKQIAQIEGILDAQAITVKDKRELESFVHTAKQITKLYSLSSEHQPLQKKLVSLPHFFRENKAKNIRAHIEYCLQNLGSFCAFKAVQLYCEKEKSREIVTRTVETEQYALDGYLKDAHKLFEEELPSDVNELFKTPEGIRNTVEGGILSHKVEQLVQILIEKSGEDPKKVCCIVFVERVIAAAVISSLLQQIDCLKCLKIDFLSSVTSTFGSKTQQKALENFSSEKVQVLVSTDVIEEGIDVKNCNCVIRFDLPVNMRSYIQSRGRARQENSEYILFLQRGNKKQEDDLFDVIKSVALIEDIISSRNDPSIKEKSTIEKDVLVDADEQLPEVTPITNSMPCTKEKSVVEKDKSRSSYEVGDVGEDLGGVSEREDKVEDVDFDLQRVIENKDELKEDGNVKEGKTFTKSGISKTKELHSTAKIDVLSDKWDEEERGVILKVYELRFTSQSNDDKIYSNFGLLIKSKLDDDIINTEIDLFVTTDKIVKAKLLSRGEMTLDLTQMRNAKDFQEIIFNGVFGNLRKKKKITEMKNLWCSSYMYFLLPLESNKSGVTAIDWKCIEICAARAREFKSLSSISEEYHNIIDIDNIKEAPMAGTTHLRNQGESEILILAKCDICESSNLIDKTVLTVHNGMFYQVVEVIHEKTAKSPFLLEKDSNSRYNSYNEYFQKRYRKKLQYLNQPLLRVKHATRPRNFLTKHQVKPAENEGTFVELPPELCLNLDVPSFVMRSLCLVPSVMHRLISLMLGNQLNKAIRKERPECPPISIQLIMEAITSHKCLECYSYERLELLGDSFLKYAISLHLVMKYENEDEGWLSDRRAEAVCNKTLHDLALDRNLQGYIIDDLFDVRKWMAPGLFCSSFVSCSCNPRDPNSLQMGKVCDKRHRWIYSKTISDVVEALIGAHLVGGGTKAALEFMRWMNMEVDIEDKSVEIAFNRHFDCPDVVKTSLDELQSLLDYDFENRCLLVEALTHASMNEHGGCSYQRLEFLGDSVLDLLITQHLYSTYEESCQGTLSDLRQIAVNNENFAQATVEHKIHNYLRHNSDELRNQIAKFVEEFEQRRGGDLSFGGGMHAPKVLGDILESISGAILVDTRLKLNVVWEKMKPILSPTVRPDNIELQPVRELYELCDQQHYGRNWKPISRIGNVNVATIQIELEKSSISGEGSDMNKKSAEIKAAKHALAQLKVMGIYHDRHTYAQSSMDATGNEAPHGSNLIAQEKMIIASSPQINSEVDMVVTLDQFHKEETHQEANLFCCSKSMQVKDLDPFPHMKFTNKMDNTLSARKHKLEEGKEEGKEGVCITDVLTHDHIESNRPKKRAKARKTELLEVIANPLISEDYIGDGKDDAIMHNSNKNCSPGARKHKLEEGKEEGKEGLCITEVLTHDHIECNRPKKRAKARNTELLETSANPLISEDYIGDGKDDAITHNSNKNCSPGGGFISIPNEDIESSHPKKKAKKVCSLPGGFIRIPNKDIESSHPKKKVKKVCSHPVHIFLNSQRGDYRRNLYELCQKMHCSEPQFTLVETSDMPHKARFLFKVVVKISNKESFSVQGEQERDHASAKDTAAYKMLVELQKHGLCSIKTFNNNCENI
ncbi:endoribonuclease Dicer homolog 3a [Cryptomeria japonica]|uniref:endoribonuclease Dicer homolog 3a n=1 Tax=Cryptomeria japonica TaxID=3369 RepID=UPI0027D9E9E5|nr:endoribonuclease Dicer homolog 3a [Cryptomeria japonica]